MKYDIQKVKFDFSAKENRSVKVLDGCIPGAEPYHHTVLKGSRLQLSASAVQSSTSDLQPVFSGLYVLSGHGVMKSADGETAMAPGDQFFVPAVCGGYEIAADPSAPLVVYRAYGAKS